MRTSRLFLIAGLLATVALAPAVTSCGSSGGTGPSNPLHTAWDATSFVSGGTDYIAAGMALRMTLATNGNYTFAFTNDQIGACTPGPNCSQTGPYSATGTMLTIDPGTVDETVFTYAIQGTTLTLTGDINGTAVTITFTKV